MDIPKPSEIPAAKPVNQIVEELKTPVRKKPFVRREHLSERVLRNHPGLIELRSALSNDKNK